MKRIIYPGPGHVLRVGERLIHRGEPADISDELYRRLVRDPSMKLVLVERELELESPAEEAATDDADTGEEESD